MEIHIVPALHQRNPPETVRVGVSTRTKFGGGFGGSGGGFLAPVPAVALPLLLPALKPPPRTTKTTTEFSSCGNPTIRRPNISPPKVMHYRDLSRAFSAECSGKYQEKTGKILAQIRNNPGNNPLFSGYVRATDRTRTISKRFI